MVKLQYPQVYAMQVQRLKGIVENQPRGLRAIALVPAGRIKNPDGIAGTSVLCIMRVKRRLTDAFFV
jgi:hypothetical protein